MAYWRGRIFKNLHMGGVYLKIYTWEGAFILKSIYGKGRYFKKSTYVDSTKKALLYFSMFTQTSYTLRRGNEERRGGGWRENLAFDIFMGGGGRGWGYSTGAFRWSFPVHYFHYSEYHFKLFNSDSLLWEKHSVTMATWHSG